MSRNRHHRQRDHFGYDLDTAMVLDGAVGTIPDGTVLHSALSLILSGGADSGDLDAINWADPSLGTDVFYHDDPSVPAIVNDYRAIGQPEEIDWSGDFTPTTGNVLLVFAFKRNAGSVAAGGGWNELVRVGPTGTVVGDVSVTCYAKISDGTETEMAYPSATADFVVMEISGVALDNIETNSNSSAGFLPAPTMVITTGSVTPTAGVPAIIIGASGVSPDEVLGHTHTPGGGWTELYDSTGTAAPFESVYYDIETSTSGSYNPTTTASTSSGDLWRGVTVSLARASGDPWLDGPNIQDEDAATYHEADSDECMRVALDEGQLAFEATVRMAFSTTEERSYSFYGTNESDYSGLVLLGETTFAPVGSNTAENISFTWTPVEPYQYYALVGPDEVRRLHELTLLASIGGIITSHPLLTNRDLTDQHPAAAVSFDDSIAGLEEDNVQGAIEKLAAHTSSGGGLSTVITNISTGVKFDFEMPFSGSISAVSLFADTAGSIVIDLWKDTYANFPPTVADSICASAKPTLSSASKYQDTTLTGWTTGFNVGDIIRVNVDSSGVLSRVTLAIRLERTASSPAIGGIQLGQIDRTALIREPTITWQQFLTLGLITQTPVIHTPEVGHIALTLIDQTAVAYSPQIS